MLPLVLSHEIVHPFKFWYAEHLCEGMCSGKQIYRLQAKFDASERKQAFTTALDSAEFGHQVCITTCSRNEYKVWVSLRGLGQRHTSSELVTA